MEKGEIDVYKGNPNKHKVGLPIFHMGSHEEVILPEESYGQCNNMTATWRCTTVDYLGDGLCEKCWDKKVWHNPYRTNVYGSSVKSVKEIYK